jgi:hypothetical protein
MSISATPTMIGFSEHTIFLRVSIRISASFYCIKWASLAQSCDLAGLAVTEEFAGVTLVVIVEWHHHQ